MKENALIVKKISRFTRINRRICHKKEVSLYSLCSVYIYCVTYINALYHNRKIFLGTMYTCILC